VRRFWLTCLLLLALTGCVSRQVLQGQRLFAGCPGGVDNDATLESGAFVCKGTPDPAPFGGNGRSCGTCHTPGDNFGISPARIAALVPSHPLFFPGLDEDLPLLRSRGLVHVVAPGGIDAFRPTPKLVHLAALCDPFGSCDALGLLGDRTRDLCAFSRQAVENHLARTIARHPGVDFLVPTEKECDALSAYMLSDLVSGQDERNAK
jgi:hypothetical protein